MLQEVWPSCCEYEGDGDITPDLELRSNHGVTGLHRDFSHVFQHVFMASDLVGAQYLDRYKFNRRKLLLKYCSTSIHVPRIDNPIQPAQMKFPKSS